ncbi:MAG: glycosyltransferase family 4 protein [Anaerolineales bacterium]
MRIGMMADTYKPYISGITNYIELNKRFLEKAGHEVYVFTFGDLDYQDDEEHIIRSPGLPLADTGFYLSLRYSRSAKKLLQSMDIVHVHHPFLSGRLALHYCRPLRIPIVFTNHTRYDLYAHAYLPMLPEEISEGLLQAYMPSFCDAVDLVVSPSRGMEKILRQLGVTSPIEIVPNGVELQRFFQAEALPRQQYGFRDDDLLLVYAGRLAPEKNLEFLLQAFSGVAQALKHVHLLLIGGGSIKQEMEEYARDIGVANRVCFVGQIAYNDLPGYLAMCDAFVTASVTEVHPLSVIEAMGAGLPVMGIQSPGVGDTVEDGVTGFLSTENMPAFTAKLTRLCLDDGLRRKMGEAARQASAHYAIERTTRMMLDHYQRLVYDAHPRQHKWGVRLRSLLELFRL